MLKTPLECILWQYKCLCFKEKKRKLQKRLEKVHDTDWDVRKTWRERRSNEHTISMRTETGLPA